MNQTHYVEVVYRPTDTIDKRLGPYDEKTAAMLAGIVDRNFSAEYFSRVVAE
jgi:hypothetical protein